MKRPPLSPSERLQKILARVGVASRRQAEALVEEGLVTINGKVAQLGDRAVWGQDAIKVRGKLLHHRDPAVFFAFYKPKHVIAAWSDPQQRPHLAPFFQKIKIRLFPMAPLDFESEGLVLLTNEGELVDLFHQQPRISRCYRVKIKGHLDAEKKARLGEALIEELEVLENKTLLRYTLFHDRSSDVAGFFERRGFLVDKVVRESIGHLSLRDMAPGSYRSLERSQVVALIEQPELGVKHLSSTSFLPSSLKKRSKRG